MLTALCINPYGEGCKVTSFYVFFVLLQLKPTCRKLSGVIPRLNISRFSPPYVVENERAGLTPIRVSAGSGHPDGPFTGFCCHCWKMECFNIVFWGVVGGGGVCLCFLVGGGGGGAGQHLFFP
jgi:hypothetical protein